MRIDVGDFYLSPYRNDDADELVRHLADGVVAQTIPVIPHPYGPAQAAEFLQARLAEQADRPATTFAIRIANGLLCGGAGLDSDPQEPQAELGYWLAPSLWGRGIMSAVVPLVVRFGRSLPLERITARAITTNEASLRILRANGFRSLGLHPNAVETSTGIHDKELFVLPLQTDAA